MSVARFGMDYRPMFGLGHAVSGTGTASDRMLETREAWAECTCATFLGARTGRWPRRVRCSNDPSVANLRTRGLARPLSGCHDPVWSVVGENQSFRQRSTAIKNQYAQDLLPPVVVRILVDSAITVGCCEGLTRLGVSALAIVRTSKHLIGRSPGWTRLATPPLSVQHSGDILHDKTVSAGVTPTVHPSILGRMGGEIV